MVRSKVLHECTVVSSELEEIAMVVRGLLEDGTRPDNLRFSRAVVSFSTDEEKLRARDPSGFIELSLSPL